MNRFRIRGGIPLCGQLKISGAKNAALPILCAALLTTEPVKICNVPNLQDVRTILKILMQMGLKITYPDIYDSSTIILEASDIHILEASYDLVKTMRASVLVLGPLLTRFGHAKVSLPGGCAIGARLIDQHIKGLKAMSASIKIEHGYIKASYGTGKNALQGTKIFSDVITVTGTENLLMAAVLANGETILENVAIEPEVIDLAKLLVKMGAKISGIGTNKLIINGVKYLHGAEHTIISDRIETGTFMCAAAIMGEIGANLILKNTQLNTLDAVVNKLRDTGLHIESDDKKNYVQVVMNHKPRAVNFYTSVYPNFPTDMQAQLMAVNSVAIGSAEITENIFENRFMHVQELNRLGANILINGKKAIVQGVHHLSGATVMATDIRAAASLVISGLAADGETTIDRIYHLDRGYECMEDKLRSVGAEIQRI